MRGLLGTAISRSRRVAGRVIDQAAAKTWRSVFGQKPVAAFDGQPRFALLTVNYSTTHYLKLMLRSLADQRDLERLRHIVICDHHSRDGGPSFLRKLSRASRRITWIENRWWKGHARGMRLAIRALRQAELERSAALPANILLHCDTDVLWLREDALNSLASLFSDGTVAFAGELRRHLYPEPEAQASFLAVRRDWAERRDVSPWVEHGQPAYWQQRDIWRRGGKGAEFPSNRAGYILHRGRSGVQAAMRLAPLSAHATTRTPESHYMGIPGGRDTWNRKEREYERWLTPEGEDALIDLLADRLGS